MSNRDSINALVEVAENKINKILRELEKDCKSKVSDVIGYCDQGENDIKVQILIKR